MARSSQRSNQPRSKRVTISAVLKEAKRILSGEDKWTKGSLARRNNGVAVTTLDSGATCYCLMGAVSKATQNLGCGWSDTGTGGTPLGAEWDSFGVIRSVLLTDYPDTMGVIGEWNDRKTTTYKDVLNVLDASIRRATENETRRSQPQG